MHRRVALAAVLVLSLSTAGVVGYRLADTGANDPREIEFSEPPDEVAYDALAQLDDRDYTVEWRIPPAPDDDGVESSDAPDRYRVFLRVTVEGSEGRLLARPGTGPVTFGNDHCRWSLRPDDRGTDRPDRCEYTGRQKPASFYGLHADWDAVRDADANVTVVRENESAVVLRVNDTDTAYYLKTGSENLTETDAARREGIRANLTLVVDREAGHLRRLEYGLSRLSKDGRQGRTRKHGRTVYVFSEWGDATVERPDWAGYSLAEFLLDATR